MTGEGGGMAHFVFDVHPPFRLDLTIWALRRRPHNSVDAWDGTTYTRTLLAGRRTLLVAVRQEPGRKAGREQLGVEVRWRGEAPSEAATAEVRHTLERMLGLGADLTGFYELAAADGRIAGLVRRFLGVRPPRFASIFEALVNAVACQQLSLTVGIHLLNRLAARYGPQVPFRGAPPGFPTPERLAAADPSDLRRIGFSMAKARTLTEASGRAAAGVLDLEGLEQAGDEQAAATLVGLPGIGRWSAEYVLLRGLGRTGILPGDDVGARNNLRRRFQLSASAGYDEVMALAKDWWPYGGLVYFHLLLGALADAGYLEAAAPEPRRRSSRRPPRRTSVPDSLPADRRTRRTREAGALDGG